MDRLTIDDVRQHSEILLKLPKNLSDLTKCYRPICMIRFIRSFTDPGAHRAKLLQLAGEKYG